MRQIIRVCQIGSIPMRIRYWICARPNMSFHSSHETMAWSLFQRPKRKYCHYIQCYSETSTIFQVPSIRNGLISASAFARIEASARCSQSPTSSSSRAGHQLTTLLAPTSQSHSPVLMQSRRLDLSFFEANGILFHRLNLEERGIYRLIAEINHTLSGQFCYCFMSKSYCHPKFETHLSRESDGDYGFHGTNTWERWQLLNFYKHVFSRPSFDAWEMQEAK
jgi:hypothetical protein